MRRLRLAILVAATCLSGSPAPAADRPTVMVLYFDNHAASPAYEGLAKGLADMMMTDLAAVPGVQVVERQKLDALLAELKLQQSKYFDAKTAQRLGQGIGAQYAVTGAFLSIEPTVRIDVRLIKIDSAAIVKAASVTGHQNDFFKLQEQLASKLTEGLSEIVTVADARMMVQSARKNRVGSLTSVLDYGKGIDARDHGDLATASKYLQKVVSNEPTFTLGKTRYAEIMKALYLAKDRREGLLSADESALVAHAEAVLARSQPTEPEAVAYRVVLGQCYLERVRKAIEKQPPASTWKADLRKFFDSQSKLIAATKDMPEYSRQTLSRFSSEDERLATTIGISSSMAGSTFFLSSPAEMMRATADIIMSGRAPIHFSDLDLSAVACPFTLDPAYGTAAVRWLEMALVHIAKHDHNYAERETMRTLQQLAKTLALLGRTEEGIAKLQGGLDAHPRSDEFKDTEELLRDLLQGPPPTSCKRK
jgi:TolB-like protein